MDTVTHAILYRHDGEEMGTPRRPVAVYTEQVDITETKQGILSSDDWRPVTFTKWEVRAIDLPAWLTPEEWLKDPLAWQDTFAIADPDWPEHWLRWMASPDVHPNQRRAAARLLKTKQFRSDFRASLCDQIITWLETDPEERQYPSPLSWKQWACLVKWEGR
jgi:hypothetical protein